MKSQPSETVKLETACGGLFVTFIYDDQGGIAKILGRFGKSGGCGAATVETACRLINCGMKGGMYIGAATIALRGIACHASGLLPSCMDAIGLAIAETLDDGREPPPFDDSPDADPAAWGD